MIVRNNKYEVPFELPEPKTNELTPKFAYIV